MSWRFDDEIDIQTDAGHVTVYRAGTPGHPALVLSHGTGFCAATMEGVAEPLSRSFEVFAMDRRGHGRSSAPAADYDWAHFARDAVCVVDALGLRDAYGVGHSAGATDLLLCAAARPRAFSRLFVLEPTAMDPAEPHVRADMAPFHEEALEGAGRRRARFAARHEIVQRYTGRGAFAGWRPDLLERFAHEGFVDAADGSVELRCDPAREVTILRTIFATMEGSYGIGLADHPFAALSRVPHPTLVASTEHSQEIYKTMAGVVAQLVPSTTSLHLDGLGHSAPQVDPERVAASIQAFWDATGGRPTV